MRGRTKIAIEYHGGPEARQAAWYDYINKKDYDALRSNKLSETNFYIAYQITFLLSKLIAEYNILGSANEKAFNISYGLHESSDKKYVLLDISGEKTDLFKDKMNQLINSVENSKSHMHELKEILKQHNLSIGLVMSANLVYDGSKSCSEKTFYKELEKRGEGFKSVIHFYVAVNKKPRTKNKSIVTSFWPQPSCATCKNRFRSGNIARTQSPPRTRQFFNDSQYTTNHTEILKNTTNTETKAVNDKIAAREAPLNKNFSIFNPSLLDLKTEPKEEEIPDVSAAIKQLALSLKGISKKI